MSNGSTLSSNLRDPSALVLVFSSNKKSMYSLNGSTVKQELTIFYNSNHGLFQKINNLAHIKHSITASLQATADSSSARIKVDRVTHLKPLSVIYPMMTFSIAVWRRLVPSLNSSSYFSTLPSVYAAKVLVVWTITVRHSRTKLVEGSSSTELVPGCRREATVKMLADMQAGGVRWDSSSRIISTTHDGHFGVPPLVAFFVQYFFTTWGVDIWTVSYKSCTSSSKS